MVAMRGHGDTWQITDNDLLKGAVRTVGPGPGERSRKPSVLTDQERWATRVAWQNFLSLREATRPPEGVTKSS